MDDNWEGGVFEDDISQKRPVDEQTQNTLTFIIEHESMLQNINSAIRDAISEAPETHYRPIRIANDKPERAYAQDLIVTDNELLQKVLTVLVFLCNESKELKEIAETKLYGPLIMCGQMPPDISEIDKKNKKKDIILSNTTAYREKMMGKFLLTLQEVSNFVDRCYEVVTNMIQQMSSLLSPKEALYRASFQTTHLLPYVKCLGELLTVLITLDNIIQQNDLLLEAWTYYKTIISHLRNDPAAFGTDEAGVTKFERLLVSLESTLMTEEIFKGCIEQDFETSTMDDDNNINVRENNVFLTEFLYSLKIQLDMSLSVIGTNMELSERYDIIGSIALYALYRRLLPANIAPDAKLHKALWTVQKTVPIVVLCERVVWNFGEFISTYANFEIKKPDPANPEVYRREYIAKFDSLLSQRTASLASQSAAWMILSESRIQPSLRHENNNIQALDIRGSILLKGLALASRASYLAKSCLVMHYNMQIPMSKANLNDIAILIEYLKAIEFTFIRKDSVISENLAAILAISSQEILDCIQPLRIKLQASRKLDPSKNDLLSSLSVIENLVRSTDSYTQIRLYTLLLTVEIVAGSKLFNEAGGNKLRSSVKRLSALANLSHNIRQVCNSSFLYFHLSILDPIVASIYQHPTQANRLQYIIAAFNDGIRLFSLVAHTDFFPFYLNYRLLLRFSITSEIIEPLCRDIETDLRLHVHTKHLDHMEALNPKSENLKTLRSLLDIAPIRMLGLIVNIKNEVTHYLDLNFYNLTTIALHDWRTYSDMRALALEKLGIKLMDNFLPMGSLDQGLDVLQIMRNIHVFVSRFTYNMNTQQFIEYRPDKASKHLNTIKIQSIAASIRQHGLGVLNTTVNFTYQFLAQKFHTFSQFLFDDYIKAHLSREHRWFKKHRNDPEINHMYPYERSLNFVRDIRKLGVSDTGKTFLDQFRILITEIGNALGYVRMVRSASMYYCSEAVKYLPDMDNIISFEKYSGNGTKSKPKSSNSEDEPEENKGGAGFSENTVKAGENLDDVIDTLVKNFGEGSDYFKVLVNVFQSVLLTSEHEHLRNFYMIVPSLCISWIEASLQAKEATYKVTRNTTKEMYFTDDGFAMGISYCLAILKQTKKNDSLHWIDSSRAKQAIDAKKLDDQQIIRNAKEKQRKEAKEAKAKANSSFFGLIKGNKKIEDEEDDDYEDMEEIHSLQLTGKRLEATRRETDQLFFSMSGAGIFFKRTDVDT